MPLPSNFRARVWALSRRIPRALFLLAGLWLLLRWALAAQGGRTLLWCFSHDERHRFTARAMLTGTLRLRNGLSTVAGDEQVYNGAGYTNWGFGVPLLQLPFHALARWMKSLSTGFFPDRAIYFLYLTVLIPVLWLALNRLLAMRLPGNAAAFKRDVLSWAGTAFILTYALYPLMSARFIVYEETICYLVVFELFALSAYVFSLDSHGLLPVGAMGLAAGVGLLVRPTGLIYLVVWGALVVLERRTRKSVAAYAAVAAPFGVFWLYSNWVKTGSPVSFGYENGLPWFPYHTAMLRFGNYGCADSIAHTWQAAEQLFKWLFISTAEDKVVTVDDGGAYLRKCHFDSEPRPPDYLREGFFGMAVLVFVIWTLVHHLVRRERRAAVYVPFASFAFIFWNYVRGPGFAWRYVGDFWPLIVLMAVQFVHAVPSPMSRFPPLRLALALALFSAAGFKKYVDPALSTIQKLDDGDVANLDKDFQKARWGTERPLPSHIECGQLLLWPYHNGQGWNSGCSVDTYTNVFLGVPKKGGGRYELRFLTEGVETPSLRVFVNGRIYTAYKAGKSYAAVVPIDYERLHTPGVMVTVEWTRELDPMPGKLVAIDLV